MRLAQLMTEERELVFRSLALCGVHIVVSLSNLKNQLDLSDSGLAEQEVKEFHFTRPLQSITDRMEDLDFKFKGIVDGWHVFAPSKHVLHNPGFIGSFEKMDVVQLNMAYQNSPSGTLGLVTAKEPGRIEIFTKALDTLRFSEREAMDHLIYISSNNSLIYFNRS